jgi:zinc/manganese transport system permease protein
MRWALLCCLVLSGIHAYLGFHVVRRGVLFVDLAMAQTAALGAAIGIVVGLEHGTPGEFALSALFALAAAVFFAGVRSRRVHPEAIVAIVYGMAMAATFVVLERSPHGMEEVKHLLVGQILTVAPRKVLVTALLYAIVGLGLARAHRSILAVTEGREGARRLGPELVFYGSFALVVTSSVGLVGVLLVFAFLVVPAVAALLLASRSGPALGWGMGIAALGSAGGLHAGFYLDLPAAPVVVLALGVLLLAAALAGRLRDGHGGRRIGD